MKGIIKIGCLVVLMLCCSHTAWAQPAYSLTIRDGRVYINEKLLEADELPPSLDVRAVGNQSITFVGHVNPSIQLGGVLYALDGQKLREVANLKMAEGALPVYFRDGTQVMAADEDASGVYFTSKDGNYFSRVTTMQEHAQALQQHTQELEQLGRVQDGAEANAVIEQARQRMQEAARVAQYPLQIEVQSYLNEVQQQDQMLYDRLIREWQLESEVRSLAMKIRMENDAAERQRGLSELQKRLSEIFELKQQNRRHEIQQLERQLEELQNSLNRREELRDVMIKYRLEELLGGDR